MTPNIAVRFVTRCSRGHSISVSDTIATDVDGTIYCKECPEFWQRRPHREEIRSNKYCPKCFLEMSITGKCDCD